jgi:hypothetical protein
MENNSTLKAIAGLITLIVLCFTMCTTCGDDGDDFYGTYTFNYLNTDVKITVTIKEGGDAVLTVDDSTRNGQAVAAHYCSNGLKYTNTANCTWDPTSRSKGGESFEGIAVEIGNEYIYLGDGRAYFSSGDWYKFGWGAEYEFEEE